MSEICNCLYSAPLAVLLLYDSGREITKKRKCGKINYLSLATER